MNIVSREQLYPPCLVYSRGTHFTCRSFSESDFDYNKESVVLNYEYLVVPVFSEKSTVLNNVLLMEKKYPKLIFVFLELTVIYIYYEASKMSP